MLEQFLSLFHRYDYIFKPLNKPNSKWFSLREEQKHWKLQDSEILKAISGVHSRYLFGCRAAKTSRFVILDIDKNSKYHTKAQLKKLLDLLSKAGIENSALYRSSDSDGWHLYIFFDEPIATIELRRHFTEFLYINGYQLKAGQLEVFPQPSNGGSVGNGIRLPLQSGFAWLNKESLAVTFERDQMSPMQALDHFVGDLKDGNTVTQFRIFKEYTSRLAEKKKSIPKRKPKRSRGISKIVPFEGEGEMKPADYGGCIDDVEAIFGALPPGINTDNWMRGREYYQSGLTGPSQRADAIFCLSHYLFYGDPELGLSSLAYGCEQEREWAIKEILETKNNGQSLDINKNRPDALSQSERCAHWVPPSRRGQVREVHERKVPIAYIRANINRKSDARRRIQEALDLLLERGTFFSTNDLVNLAKCSVDTLYKNADLWRQSYEEAKDGELTTSTGQINVGKGSDSSKINSPFPSNKKDKPLGILACRQILSEIKMRADREEKKKEKRHLKLVSDEENRWLLKAKSLLPKSIKNESTEKLKASVSVLTSVLSLAPHYDAQVWLASKIQDIDRELDYRITAPKQLRLLKPK